MACVDRFDLILTSLDKSRNTDRLTDRTPHPQSTNPTELKKWREAELKHGRVAMLAVLGTAVQENYHP